MDEYNWTQGMWWIILLIALWMLFTGCTRKIYIPVEHKTIETVTLRDTIVQVKLDVIHDSVIIPDTISNLENKYATSYAAWSQGKLRHSLNSKPVSLPVKVQYVEKENRIEIPQPYPVEVVKYVERELTWWQKMNIWMGKFVLMGLAVGVLMWFVFRK